MNKLQNEFRIWQEKKEKEFDKYCNMFYLICN